MSKVIQMRNAPLLPARPSQIALAVVAALVGVATASLPAPGEPPPEPGDGQVGRLLIAPGAVRRDELRQRAPIAVDDSATTDEGRVIDIAVLANDRDPDGDALRVASITQGVNGWVLINGDHTLRYQPNTGFTGLDGFAYTVDDGRGGKATAIVTVEVDDVPDAPVAENQVVTTDEDTALAITLVASDADRDPLTFAIERPPEHGSLLGTPPDLSYVPDADYSGPDRFVFAVDDGHGGRDIGTVWITTAAVDDVPEAVDDEAVTHEGMVVDIAVLANDRDPDGGTLTVARVTQAANGWVLINGDHTLRYQPNTGFTGLDGFAYTVVDADGGTDTAAVGVNVRERIGEEDL